MSDTSSAMYVPNQAILRELSSSIEAYYLPFAVGYQRELKGL
jgi:hypothetical protein